MEHLNVNEQLMYKIAALDASVQAGFRRLDEKMDRFQSDLHDSQIHNNDRINRLDKETAEKFALKKARVDALTDRMNSTETWQKVAMAKVGVITGSISLFLVFFAPTIRNILGIAG